MQIKMVISRPLIHSRQNNKDGSNKQQKYFWKIAFLRHLTLQSIHLAWSNFGPIHLRQRVFFAMLSPQNFYSGHRFTRRQRAFKGLK